MDDETQSREVTVQKRKLSLEEVRALIDSDEPIDETNLDLWPMKLPASAILGINPRTLDRYSDPSSAYFRIRRKKVEIMEAGGQRRERVLYNPVDIREALHKTIRMAVVKPENPEQVPPLARGIDPGEWIVQLIEKLPCLKPKPASPVFIDLDRAVEVVLPEEASEAHKGLLRKALRRAVAAGRLPAVGRRGTVLVRMEDVRNFVPSKE